MTERLRVREIEDDEGRRLVRIIRRGSGSVVTWRRAQMVLLSAQGMDVPAIAKVAFTSEDRLRRMLSATSAALRVLAEHGLACRFGHVRICRKAQIPGTSCGCNRVHI